MKTENLRQYYAIQLSYITPANIDLKAGLLFELTRSVYGTVSPDDGVMKVSTQQKFPSRSEWEVLRVWRVDGTIEGAPRITARRVDLSSSSSSASPAVSFSPVECCIYKGRDAAASYDQFPMRVNFAATFASTIGRTILRPVLLDFVRSPPHTIPDSMTYTVLSRLQDLTNARVKGLTPAHFYLNQTAKDFWESLSTF